jgi:D-alanyl-D-alanine carboxypeptidase
MQPENRMTELSDRIPIPPKDQMNAGLTSATEKTMLAKFGIPGALTVECAPPTGPVVQRIKSDFDVGPFKVTGLDYAVESLRQIFGEVRNDFPDVYSQIRTAGVLCVRHRRNNPARFSNHSWGCSIDIYFGARVVPQGLAVTHRGNFLLNPIFCKYGWYWGAEFSGDSVDSMHFELAEETVLKMPTMN